MRIGVLTYHCVPNFGAQLQATSTVGYIRRMGHEAVVLHWYPTDLEEMYAKRIPAGQIEAHNAYTRNNLPITPICRTEDDLLQVISDNKLDAIIVGSDALFKYVPEKLRKRFCKRKLRYNYRTVLSVERLEGNPFLGGFIKRLGSKMPVFAFSVSSQNCPYYEMKNGEKSLMNEAMKHFTSITVRDEWTKNMVESILGCSNIKITPDPVFSFNQNSYLDLPTKEELIKKFKLADKYVLLSFSTWYTAESYIQELALEVKSRGFQPVAFPMPEGLNAAGIETQIPLPLDPLEWYALIKYSAGYIGERMHPIVVCLHNAVPFYSFDEYGTYKNYLGIWKTYLQSSSKTYRILERAKLTLWLHSYKMNKELPSPKLVINLIESFDKTKCTTFAQNYQKQYDESMHKLLLSL